jgi:hypothetical protein
VADHCIDPRRKRTRQVAPNLGVGTTGSRRYMEGMIGVPEELELGTIGEPCNDRLDQIELCEVVARSLKKQHRDLHADQVLGA